eukprot:TRINITY_DN12208_c0_g1_i1.p1 TRINITY_DN12208_c0_g1~~TRINITY_DN12208_c0_g1_i1.p1  ORF type:complete len:264 (-),score=117.06 TRINITY_DN12208_c0_g1_i1:113-904(-)
MPKNKGKGGKGKRKGKNKGKDQEKREIRFKDVGEEYAQIRKVLGNCRVEAYCFDGKPRLAHVRGRFKKRVWINKDDFVLLGLRDYQDGKGDVIHKYTPDEARLLRSWGEIPADKALFGDDLDSEDRDLGEELGPIDPADLSSNSEDDDDDEDKDDDDEDGDEEEDGDEDEDSEEEDIKPNQPLKKAPPAAKPAPAKAAAPAPVQQPKKNTPAAAPAPKATQFQQKGSNHNARATQNQPQKFTNKKEKEKAEKNAARDAEIDDL